MSTYIDGDENVKRPHQNELLESLVEPKRRRSNTPSPTVIETGLPTTTPSVNSIYPKIQQPVTIPWGTRCKVKEEYTGNYGSEEDSDLEDECEDLAFPTFVPRVQRLFFEDLEPGDPKLPAQEIKREPIFITPPPLSSSDFVWTELPDNPVLSTARREKFSEINCGPTTACLTPYDAFIAIWSKDFMEYIANETNRYAQQVADKSFQDGTLKPNSPIIHWHDTNADELYVYFALLLGMGLCVKSDIKEYWSKDDLMATPNFGRYMSISRFSLITTCLHFNNNSTDLRNLTRADAKLYKIAPVIEHLNERFQYLYRLGQNIVMDESLTHWKGLLDIEKYRSHGAGGIRTFEVSEAETGYLWSFKVHAGEKEDVESRPGLISNVKLIFEVLNGLEQKGRTVWMGNNYTSPDLARVLKSLGFDCVGTVKTNASCVPSSIEALMKSEMAVGAIFGCTSGDVDILVWQGRSRVALVSTYHGSGVHTANGISKPIALRDLNMCLSGLDRKDQMLCAYPIERTRRTVWYKKLFRRLLNVSVLNAYIIHKQSLALDTTPRIIQHRNFRKTLVSQILSGHVRKPVAPVVSTNTTSASEPEIPGKFKEDVLQHFPTEYGLLPNTTKNEKIRRCCVICKKRVQSYCKPCNVALCVYDCYKSYHRLD